MAAAREQVASTVAAERAQRDIGDEATLGAGIRAGSAAAFEALVRAYADPLAAFAYGRVGSRVEATEIVQDVFVKIWERRTEWRVQAGGVSRYLYAAVRNHALNRVRDRRVHERRTVAADTDIEIPAADAAIMARDLEQAVARAIATLPERCRETLELRVQHELSRAAVAEVLGITLKAVEANTTRALKLLRVALANYR